MAKSQKSTIYYFGLALAIVCATAAFLRLSLPAQAAETLMIAQDQYSCYGAFPSCDKINFDDPGEVAGQSFIASSSSFSSVWLNLQSGPFITTSTVTLCKGAVPAGSFATSTAVSCGFPDSSLVLLAPNVVPTQPSGTWFKFALPVVKFLEIGAAYYVTVEPNSVTAGNNYAWSWNAATDPTDIYPEGRQAGQSTTSDLVFRIYSDSENTDWSEYQEVIILDNETIFQDGLAYSFENDKRCLAEHPEIPCDLKWWFSPDSLGVPLYFFYDDGTGQPDGDQGIIASTTPTDWFSYSATTSLPNVGTTSSAYYDYCVMAYSTSTLSTFRSCGIRVAWLADDMIERYIEEQTASATIAAKKTDCLSCTEESGFFGCSLKQAYCYLFIPDAEDVMRIYDLKKKAETGFPLNIFSDLKNSFYQLSASSTATSSGVLAASTTGLYLYWNGTKTAAPILTPEILATGVPTLWSYVNTWLGYALYFILILYLIKRLRQMSSSVDSQ